MASSKAGSDESATLSPEQAATKKKAPVRPVTPRLRIVLYVVLTLFGVLAANGLYLTSITWLQKFTGEVYETHFYQLMFLMHLGLGLLLISPVVGFGFLHMWRARNRRNRSTRIIEFSARSVSLLSRVGLNLKHIPPT